MGMGVEVVVPDGADGALATGLGAGFAGCVDPAGLAVPRYAVGGAMADEADAGLAAAGPFCEDGRTGTLTSVRTVLDCEGPD